MIDQSMSYDPSIRSILAADARYSMPDYVNDHIWEFSTMGVEPPALMLQTTYGLRAYWMRLFPAFTLDGVSLTDPRTFAEPPFLAASHPSYLNIHFSPFPSIDVQMEYWVPTSQTIASRIQIKNTSTQLQNFKMIWNVQLNPIGHGQRMAAQQVGMNTVLHGHTQNLSPVFYITGGPEPLQTPFPSLAINMMMQPGLTRTITWALASLRSMEESFSLARQITGRNWDVELLKMEMAANRQDVVIEAPEADWNEVFVYSQKRAFQLLMGSTPKNPGKFLVQTRNPDQGYSLRGDGSDYGPDWAGMTALQVWYMSKFLLPGNPEFLKEIFIHFLDAQKDDGFIPNLIGCCGQQSYDCAAPILSEIAWKIFLSSPVEEWLTRVFPALLRHFQYWIKNSRTQNNILSPVWNNPAQAGLEAIDLFSPQNPFTHAIHFQQLVSPGLLAMLYRECKNLVRMAEVLKAPEIAWLNSTSLEITDTLEKCWCESRSSYRWMDLENLTEIKSQKLCAYQKNGKFTPGKHLFSAARIAVCIQRGTPALSNVQITIHGRSNNETVSETLTSRQIQWQMQYGRGMTTNTFSTLEEVEIAGLNKKDRIQFYIPGTEFEDISLLLPLWAGIPIAKRAHQMIEKTVARRYLSPAGLANLPRKKTAVNFPSEDEVSLFWNSMIIEGLQNYHADELAAQIFATLLDQSARSLKSNHGLFPSIQIDPPTCCGDRDSLSSLLPAVDLNRVLGIHMWTDHEMIISNFNTFFPPINVKYNRTKVEFLAQETKIQSINGETQSISGPLPNRILFP